MQRPRIRIPNEYPFALAGGLDLQTSQLSLRPGAVIGGQNYECLTAGGYQRIGGYERFDGRPKPSAATYVALQATTTFDASLAVGNTLTGATSGATGIVCYIATDRTFVAVTKVSGTFTSTEVYNKSGVPMATGGGTATGITRAIDNAILAAAAALYRADITTVPGSGSIRGVTALNDVVYAFRHNAGGTAVDIYKSTGSGWTQVPIGIVEVKFTAGQAAGIAVGDALTTAGGFSGTVIKVAIRTGSFSSSNAAGSLFFATATGTVASGEAIKRGASTVATAGTGTPQSTVSLAPNGRFEFAIYNFTGSTQTTKIYGCDGVNRAFEFDGTRLYPITTGMAIDAPSHITAFRHQLVLSFLGSVQVSGVGDPFNWSVITGGATEIAVGDAVTGFLVMPGSTTGGALFVLCRNRAYTLYGSSGNYNLVELSDVGGGLQWTAQVIGNAIYLDDIGLTSAAATQNFGNFAASTISEGVRPLLEKKTYLAVASVCVRQKNQYKVFFSDKTGLTVTFGVDRNGAFAVAGILPFSLPNLVTSICSVEISGAESTFFGSDDGYVYQMNKGRSFDGAAITAYLRLPFTHCRSPNTLKRFRAAVIEAKSEAGGTVSVTPEFSFGSTDQPAALSQDATIGGAGARYDESNWDQAFWDETDYTPVRLRIDGRGDNVSLNLFHSRADELTHTLQAVTLVYSALRQER